MGDEKGERAGLAAVAVAPAHQDLPSLSLVGGNPPGDRYRRLFEQAPWGLFQTTADGRYLDANPALARLYGYDTPQELLAALTDIGSQLYVDAGRREDFLRAMHDQGVLHDFEARIRRRDGSVIWISENCRVVRDASGHPLYYEGTVVEITARKQAEAALRDAHAHAERANAAKERFLGLVTHELRTPLHAILGFAELIGELEENETAERDDYLREVRTAAGSLLRTVNRLLDYTRLTTGAVPAAGVLTPLEPLLAALIRQHASPPPSGGTLGNGRIILRHRDGTTPPCVTAVDPDLLKRALGELLSNALTHAPADTAVVLEIGETPDATVVSVIDQGPGLSADDLQALAVPFGTTILQARSRQQGLSLGLPIAQTIAAILGGRLELESSLLSGTTARLILPAPGSREPGP